MLGKKVFELIGLGWSIVLWQDGPDSFSVTQGDYERVYLTYNDAATAFGNRVMKTLADLGRLGCEEDE